MNFWQLKVFCTVVQRGSISETARALHLSQPAVSLQLLRLEEFVGARLLNRSQRGVTPTEAGRMVYEHARAIGDLHDELLENVRRLSGRVEGKVSVRATYSIGEYWLPHIIGAFREAYPLVEITMRVQDTPTVVQAVLEGEVDVGLVEGMVDSKAVRVEPLFHDELVLVAAPDHPWTRCPEITADDLAAGAFLWRFSGVSSRERIMQGLRRLGFAGELRDMMHVGSTEAIKSMVEAKVGVAFLSSLVIQKELQLGTLTVVPVKGLRVRRPLCIVHPRTVRYPQAVIKLLNDIRQAAATVEPGAPGRGGARRGRGAGG